MKKPTAEEILAVLVLALELAKLIGEWIIEDKRSPT
jgi:hypothetical protein